MSKILKKIGVEKSNIIYMIIKIISWILVLVGPTVYLLLKIENFSYMVEEDIIQQDSFIGYKHSIYIMFGVCIFLTFVWWLAHINLNIREKLENNTFIWTVTVVVFCIIITGLLQIKFPGFDMCNKDSIKHILGYIWSYPCLFTGNILLFSPNNICEVIVPWGRDMRYIIGIVLVAVGIGICIS